MSLGEIPIRNPYGKGCIEQASDENISNVSDSSHDETEEEVRDLCYESDEELTTNRNVLNVEDMEICENDYRWN